MTVSWEIRQGDAIDRLRDMPAESVQCVITSPPYYGLRDYGTGEWEGGNPECDHLRPLLGGRKSSGLRAKRDTCGALADDSHSQPTAQQFRDACGKCGARRVDRQLGLEPTPDEYVVRLVEVFREVRRVLRDDATLWLSIGDSYANDGKWGGSSGGKHVAALHGNSGIGRGRRFTGLKSKDLIGIPWLLAFALRADGWYLRSEIIWAKPNPMPESVTDRPTSAHEKVFLFAKSKSYFYDADAIREEGAMATDWPNYLATYQRLGGSIHSKGDPLMRATDSAKSGKRAMAGAYSGMRNKRNVWTIATQPYPEAHFATFPTELVEPCVLAGSSPWACGECGAPWRRVVERTTIVVRPGPSRDARRLAAGCASESRRAINGTMTEAPTSRTVGWRSSCAHDDDTGRCVVLDPFAGSGTVGVVALRHDRSFIGIELNPAYCELARRRIRDDAPLLNAASEAAA